MGIKQTYERAGLNAVASYNYTDIAEGTGIVIFNLCNTKEESTINYFLTTQVFRPDTKGITTMSNTQNAEFQKKLDLDFDVVFNKPQRIKGTWFYTSTACSAHSGTGSHQHYYIVKLRKVTGGVETDIASVQSQTYAVSSSGVTEQDLALQAEITESIHFKIGDTLRVTVETWIHAVSGGTSYTAVIHNPPDTDIIETYGGVVATQTIENSKTSVYIPFLLNL